MAWPSKSTNAWSKQLPPCTKSPVAEETTAGVPCKRPNPKTNSHRLVTRTAPPTACRDASRRSHKLHRSLVQTTLTGGGILVRSIYWITICCEVRHVPEI